MKQLQKTIFPLILALILVLSTGMTVLATGEGNIDGGGGGMGSGTKTDVWHSQDGVRVTVVTTSGSVVSTPFDLTNSSIPNAVAALCREHPGKDPAGSLRKKLLPVCDQDGGDGQRRENNL